VGEGRGHHHGCGRRFLVDKVDVLRFLFILVAAVLAVVAPASAAVYNVPTSITDDCSADVTQPILDWIASVPDNSTLVFGARACYRVDGTLELTNRSGLEIRGNDSTFQASTTGAPHRAHWRFLGGTGNTLRYMTILGANPSPGTYKAGRQWQHGVDLRGVAAMTIEHVTIIRPYGDGVYVGKAIPSHTWSSNVTIRYSVIRGTNRQGVAVVAGDGVTIHRNTLRNSTLNAVDIEPNGAAYGARMVAIVGNTVVAPIAVGHGDAVFAVLGSGPVSSVWIANNTIQGQGGRMAIIAPVGERRSNIAITGNTADTGYSAPGSAAIDFVRISDATVTANTIPLSGANMALVAALESRGIKVFGNSHLGGVDSAFSASPSG
jgi:hypothetical protein